MDKSNNGAGENRTGDEYDAVLMLDDMESLLEDLEDAEAGGQHSSELQRQMRELGVANIDELRERISTLHARLDAEEG